LGKECINNKAFKGMIPMAMMDLTLTTVEGEEDLKELKLCMKILEILIAFQIKF
jgi:hypothetical protein